MFKAWHYHDKNCLEYNGVIWHTTLAKARYALYKRNRCAYPDFMEFCQNVPLYRSPLDDLEVPAPIEFDFNLSDSELQILRNVEDSKHNTLDTTFRKLHRLGLCYYYLNWGKVVTRTSSLGEAYLIQSEKITHHDIKYKIQMLELARTILKKRETPFEDNVLELEVAKTLGARRFFLPGCSVNIHCGMWGSYYGYDYAGYTQKRNKAGVYKFKDALRNCLSDGRERLTSFHILEEASAR